jgi:hypothetical protein
MVIRKKARRMHHCTAASTNNAKSHGDTGAFSMLEPQKAIVKRMFLRVFRKFPFFFKKLCYNLQIKKTT